MMKKIMIGIVLMVFIPSLALALSVKARVDKNRMTSDDSLTLTVSVNDGNAEIDTSSIRDFQIVSQSTGSNFQWINGKSSSEYTHNYILSPIKQGRLVIPALPVIYKGNTIYTEKIDIVVDNKPVSQGLNADLDIFVRAAVNDDSPYPGQQIIYTFTLYYAVQISSPSLKLPEFKNFSVKENDKDNQLSTLINGREYQVIERNVILDPLKPGAVLIPPASLTCQVAVANNNRRRSSDPFDSFFNDPLFGRAALSKKTLRTNPLTVRVLPLPKNPYPNVFTGLVGRFDLKSDLETDTIKVGDATTLSLTVEGTGNVMDALEPVVNVPTGFKMYKDTPQEDITQDKNGFSGKKTFRFALVGVTPGSYTIPPVSITYFDVEKGVYHVLSTKPFSIHVNPSPDGTLTQAPAKPEDIFSKIPGQIKKKVEYTGHDILPLKESLDGSRNCFSLSFMGFILCLAIPLMFFGMVKAVVVYSGRGKTVSALMVERAEKSLRQAGQKGLGDQEFLSRIYLAFVSIVFAKSGTTGETLTKREVRSILESIRCEVSVIEDAETLLDRIESGRFAGRSMDDAMRQSLLEDTRTMMRRIG